MSDVSIVVDDREVMSLLRRAPDRINVALRAALTDATALILRDAKTYPPPPDAIQGPSSSPVRFSTRAGKAVNFTARSRGWSGGRRSRYVGYKRTGTLGRSWHKSITGRGIDMVGEVKSEGNKAPYNRYVQDAEHQSRVHQGRWSTIQSIADNRRDDINRIFDARIAAALR